MVVSLGRKPKTPTAAEKRAAQDSFDIEAFVVDLGSAGSHIELFRKLTTTGTWDYLGIMQLVGWSRELVRLEYGGGRYRADVKTLATDDKAAGWAKKHQFTIAGPPKAIVAPVDEEKASPAAAEATMFAFLREQAAENRLATKEILEASNASKGGFFEGDVGKVVALAIPALIERLLNPPESKSQVDSLIQGMKLAKGMGGAGDAGYGPVLTELGKPLIGMLQQGLMKEQEDAKKLTPGKVPPLPSPNPPAAPAPAQPTTPPTIWDRIGGEIPRLQQFKKIGAEPETMAVMVLDVLPAEQIDGIADLMTGEVDFSATFFARFPMPDEADRVWFTSFLTAMKDLIFVSETEEGEALEGEPEGGQGDAGDPIPNETAGDEGGGGSPIQGVGEHGDDRSPDYEDTGEADTGLA